MPVFPDNAAAHSLVKAITEVQASIAENRDFSAVFEQLLEVFLELTESEYGFIGEVLEKDGGERYLKTHAITNIAWNQETRAFYEENAPSGLEFFNLKSLFGQVIVTEEVVIANEPATDPRRCGLPEGHPDMRAFLGLPFRFRGQMVGMVGIANRQGGYDSELVDFLEPLLVTCASTLALGQTERSRDHALTASMRAERDARALFESAVDGIMTIDEKGTILSANPTTESMFGYARQELVGNNVSMLMPEPDRGAHDGYLRRYLDTGEARVIGIGREVVGRRRSGMTFPVELSVSEVQLDEGRGFLGIVRDISARCEAQGRLSSFFEVSLDLLCIASPDGYFKELNPAWEKTLGFSNEALKSRPFLEFVHPDDREATLAETAKLIEGAKTINFENRYVCVDGTYRWLLWTAAFDAAGQALIAAARDATLHKENTRQLEDAKLSAEEANRAKSQFLATMSHEFRTPMNAIIGFSKMLGKNKPGNLDTLQLNQIERIADNGVHLLHLINDILDLSKIEAGKLELVHQPFDLMELLASVRCLAETQSAGRPLLLDWPASTPPRWVLGDRLRLKQVLINLISNAVKFTEEGEIRLRVDTESQGRGLCISVSDTGIGIADDRLECIFRPFEQADDSLARQYHGTGLGLAIVKQLVERMGFEIEVESEPGKGSTFRILIGLNSLTTGPDCA